MYKSICTYSVYIDTAYICIMCNVHISFCASVCMYVCMHSYVLQDCEGIKGLYRIYKVVLRETMDRIGRSSTDRAGIKGNTVNNILPDYQNIKRFMSLYTRRPSLLSIVCPICNLKGFSFTTTWL